MKTVTRKVSGIFAGLVVTLAALCLWGCQSGSPTQARVTKEMESFTIFQGEQSEIITDEDVVRHARELLAYAEASDGPEDADAPEMFVAFGSQPNAERLPLIRDRYRAYVQFADGWYEVADGFYDLVCDMLLADEKPVSAFQLEFLKEYGWTPVYELAEYTVRLPSAFDQSTDSPEAMFWAVINEYSKAIGLDLSACSGEEVIVEQLRLAERVRWAGDADDESPERPEQASIVRQGENIFGAWLGSTKDGHSLDGRTFADTSGMPIVSWLDSRRSADSYPLTDPEQVIQTYFSLANQHDCAGAISLVSSNLVLDWAINSVGASALYDDEFQPFPEDTQVEFVRAVEYAPFDGMEEEEDTVNYLVTFDIHLPPDHRTAYSEGQNQLFYILRRTPDGAGWRIWMICSSL